MTFVSRKPAGYDSAPHSQYHDKIAAHRLHGVDTSCTKSTTSSDVKRRDTRDADDENESSDQCEVQSQFSYYFFYFVVLSLFPVCTLGDVICYGERHLILCFVSCTKCSNCIALYCVVWHLCSVVFALPTIGLLAMNTWISMLCNV